MQKKTVGIIGAGIAGLNCARLLEDKFEVSLFDKNSKVGGRILSSEESGFILDHGFQVYLPGYPEAREAFNNSLLDLNYFSQGALIRVNDKFHNFSDPMREPKNIFYTLLAPIGNLKDKFLILKLKKAVKKIHPELRNISTYDYLKDFGFSEEMIARFFKPFFSGIFLERELNTSAYFFSFLFDIFSTCKAAIPKNGMMELPLNLLNQLKKTKLLLNTEITKISGKEMTINGSNKSYDYIICAYDNITTEFQTVTTDYFQTDKCESLRPTLFLNGNSSGVINHIAPMSAVNPNYGPKEQELWAVNLLTPNQDTSIQEVEKELKDWFQNKNFTHIKRYTIRKSLPKTPQYGQREIKVNGIYQCGDHMQDPSINGALKSGRLVAEKILLENE